MRNFTIVFFLFLNFTYISSPDAVHKYELIVFEGSDWCFNCIRLEKKILKDTSFMCYLDSMHIKLIKIDFPQRKKMNQEERDYNKKMAEKYAFNGIFPTIVLAPVDRLQYKNVFYTNQSIAEFKYEIQQIIKGL